MTFSVLGSDGRGAVGIAVTSSSPAVAARCIHLRAGVGGASSQNVTDPRLGPALLDALESGSGAQAALDSVVRGHDLVEHRQLTVLAPGGDGAAHSGSASLGVHRHRVEPGVVAAGNMLAAPEVVDAVAESFAASTGELERRLLTALEAGLAAGGEAGPVHSAGLSVVREVSWRETDLRIDWSDSPIADLRDLLEIWLPQRDDYVTRALDPTAAPSYGVPGDER
ncbi:MULTISPECIES: DUF1028 domain-containing protein [unclassified Saccharopolyspora]|uniref:DUF1028 domain-containing protein n=1 Tax=unclassified Saccharopolyspora TaxID=2646250 RepID=UPI001CD7BE61|nr:MULTISPECIES: DUF1028 domain-containing protein [unclassified Saccharopolyspora]MCA1190629.1 DUF1028 domain-containing protein [Saccharopolyspora sp. 6V]MCA1229733.1 DUF1028 domain-containing protein [Saccharopolyspora sp. 6M]